MVGVMTNLTIISGGALRKQGKNDANAGLALINRVFDADIVRAMVNADRFSKQVQEAGLVHLEEDQIKHLHRSWLPNVAHADEAFDLLSGITGADTLTPAEAGAMLQYLFAATGRRRNDEAAAKLMACIDIFNPASNALGPALGLWESAPAHPVILAITIKQLMAEKTFEPAEAELREALGKVKQRLSAIGGWTWRWRETLDEWDRSIFKCDRAAWDDAYANVVDSKVVLAMREWSEMSGEGPWPEDGEFPATPGEPRWLALEHLLKAKRVAVPPKPKHTAPIIAAARQARGHTKRSKTTRQRAPKPVEADASTSS
jgi:hypothetical protein